MAAILPAYQFRDALVDLLVLREAEPGNACDHDLAGQPHLDHRENGAFHDSAGPGCMVGNIVERQHHVRSSKKNPQDRAALIQFANSRKQLANRRF